MLTSIILRLNRLLSNSNSQPVRGQGNSRRTRDTRLIYSPLEPRQLLATIATVNINTLPYNTTISTNDAFIDFGDKVAWLSYADISIGDAEGNTTVLKDVFPKTLASLGDKLVFTTGTGSETQLWITDGTQAGTGLLYGQPDTFFLLNYGGAPSQHEPGYLNKLTFEHDGLLYFRGTDQQHGREIWVTDGTASGTELLIDLVPGPGSSFPDFNFFNVFKDRVYFVGEFGDGHDEIFVTGGTTSSTRRVTSLGDRIYSSPVLADDGLYFKSGLFELHIISGLRGSRLVFAGGTTPEWGLEPGDGGLYFSADQNTYFHSRATGTNLLGSARGDGQPYLNAFAPVYHAGPNTYFLDAAGQLNRTDGVTTTPLHQFNEPVKGVETLESGVVTLLLDNGEVWSSDGTSTSQIADDVQSHPYRFRALNGLVYFSKYEAGEIWSTDGTSGGTIKIGDVEQPLLFHTDLRQSYLAFFSDVDNSGYVIDGASGKLNKIYGAIFPRYNHDIKPVQYREVNGGFYFRVDDFDSTSTRAGGIWFSDGTFSDTRFVSEESVTDSSAPSAPVSVNGKYVFSGRVGNYGEGIFVSASGLFNDVENLVMTRASRYEPTIINGNAMFGSKDGLYVTNGSRAGTIRLNNQSSVPIGSLPNGNVVFHSRDNNNDFHIGLSDGTASGTATFIDLPAASYYSGSRDVIQFGGKLYFMLNGQVWETDGTNSGSGVFHATVPWSPMNRVFEFQNEIYMIEGSHGDPPIVWKSDGISEPELVSDWPEMSQIREVVKFDGFLYIRTDGHQIWKSDGTGGGTSLFFQGNAPFGDQLVEFQNRLFFVSDAVLFSTDGSTIRPETSPANPDRLFVYGSRLYFIATTPETGNELYYFSNSQSFLVDGHLPGPDGLNPSGLSAGADRLFFRLYTPEHGAELGWLKSRSFLNRDHASSDLRFSLRTNAGTQSGEFSMKHLGSADELPDQERRRQAFTEYLPPSLMASIVFIHKEVSLEGNRQVQEPKTKPGSHRNHEQFKMIDDLIVTWDIEL